MVCPETQRVLVSSRAWNAVPSFWTSFHANRSTSAVWRHFTQSRHVKQQCLSRGIFHRQQAQKNMCRPFAWVAGKEHNTLDPRYQRFTRFRISCKHPFSSHSNNHRQQIWRRWNQNVQRSPEDKHDTDPALPELWVKMKQNYGGHTHQQQIFL